MALTAAVEAARAARKSTRSPQREKAIADRLGISQTVFGRKARPGEEVNDQARDLTDDKVDEPIVGDQMKKDRRSS